jgi:hypothetical protein
VSSDYTLGQPVTFTQTLSRVWATVAPSDFTGPHPKKWVPIPNPGAGIIIGRRTLSNGVNTGLYSDDGISYKATEHFTAYLVVETLNSKPVHVLPEHLAPADDTPPPAPEPTQFPGQTAIDL